MKTVFIHAGLHKTGTTSLQSVLLNNRKNLSEQDFYYPLTGIPDQAHGHHNIAWQLSHDRRYRPEWGDLRALLKEIEQTDGHKIILSSEDFECSLLRPQRLNKLLNDFKSRNYKVCLLIYLRNPLDYLTSLYLELLKAGLGDEFNAYLRKVILTNKFEYKEWEFVFNHSEMVKSIHSLKDIELVTRDYDHLIGNDTVLDFCHALQLDDKKINMPPNTKQLNRRHETSTLLKLFFRNRANIQLKAQLDVVDELLEFRNQNLDTSQKVKDLFHVRARNNAFYKSNNTTPDSSQNSDSLNIEKLFSFETCNLLNALNQWRGDVGRKEQLIADWRQWVKQVS